MPSVPTWLWWSSGKDSAWSLHTLRERLGHPVTRLITTMNGDADRVAMHAVRRELLERQAAALRVGVRAVDLPAPCSNAQYEAAVEPVFHEALAEGATAMAFGDLFLTDVRDYRLKLLEGRGIDPLFPIWGLDTQALAEEMIASGLRAHITCIDPRVMPRELAGCEFDRAFLAALPKGVDPCGENGEFHTFAWDGPMFAQPVPVTSGAVVERDGFVFADLTPA